LIEGRRSTNGGKEGLLGTGFTFTLLLDHGLTPLAEYGNRETVLWHFYLMVSKKEEQVSFR